MAFRKCPECRSIMTERYHDWVNIDSCTSCGWVFLDFLEMKDIIDNLQNNKSFKKIQKWDSKFDNIWKNIICSNCWELMDEREYIYGSWNHIDFCRSCGWIYLDQWELEEIKNFEISRIHSEEGKKLYSKIENLWLKISHKQKETLKTKKLDNNEEVWIFYWIISKLLNL